MKRSILFFGAILLVLAASAVPVQAFTAKSLDIAVLDSGDAQVTFDYELSWIENVAVFVKIADPGNELKKAIENNFKNPVDVTEADAGRSQMFIHGFAAKNGQDGTITLVTPTLSFQNAERVLNQYWFAPLINPDFSPDITTVSFPDGFSQTFYNTDTITPVTHTY